MTQPPGDPVRYRIAELARLSTVNVRNIREYQDRGLLPPPSRVGRVAVYNDEHLVRLRLIVRLLSRGYTIAVIRELIDAWSSGRDLHDVLGLEAIISKPWTEEQPGRIGLLEARRRFRGQLTPARLRRVLRLGILTPTARGFDVPSPRLLEAGADLVAEGIPLARVLDVFESVQADLQNAADRIADLVFESLLPADAPGGLPTGEELPRVTNSVQRMRPHAQRAVEALFAKAMTQAVDKAVHAVAGRALSSAPHLDR